MKYQDSVHSAGVSNDYEHMENGYNSNRAAQDGEWSEHVKLIRVSFAVVWHSKWFIIFMAIVGGLVGYAVSQHRVLTYASSAIVLFDSKKPVNVPGSNIVSRMADDRLSRSNQILLISSGEITTAAVDLLIDKGYGNLANHSSLQAKPSVISEIVVRLQEAVSDWIDVVVDPIESFEQAILSDADTDTDTDTDRLGVELGENQPLLLDREWTAAHHKLFQLVRSSVSASLYTSNAMFGRSGGGAPSAIQIGANTLSPSASALIANAVADAYVQYLVDQRSGILGSTIEVIRKSVSNLQGELDKAERAVADYAHKVNKDVGLDVSLLAERLSDLSGRVLEREDLLSSAIIELKRLNGLRSSDRQIFEYISTADSAVLRDLSSRLEVHRLDFSKLELRYGPKHPKVITATAEMQHLETVIRSEFANLLSTKEQAVEVLQLRTEALRTELRETEDLMAEMRSATIDLKSLEREAAATRALYEQQLGLLRTATDRPNLDAPEARVVAKAMPQSASIAARTFRHVSTLAVLGMIAGLGVVALLALMDDTYRSMQLLSLSTGLPVSGTIPKIKVQTQQRGECIDYALNESSSIVREAVRLVRTSLDVTRRNSSTRTIAVTSSIPGEGKTVLASWLAMSYANSGGKTLLVDFDLRMPQLKDIFAKYCVDSESGNSTDEYEERRYGVTDVLFDGVSPEIAARETTIENLSILTSSRVERSHLDRINSKTVDSLVEACRSSYDFVIFDCPPLRAVAEARHVTSSADQVVYAVKWGVAKREWVKLGLSVLKEDSTTVSCVLTNAEAKKSMQYDGYNENVLQRHYDKYYKKQHV